MKKSLAHTVWEYKYHIVFKKYRDGDQTKAYEQVVPQVALLHQ